MKRASTWILAFAALMLIDDGRALARTVYFGSEAEIIATPFGRGTLLRFPKPVQTVTDARQFKIGPLDSESPDYSVLEVRPIFAKGQSTVSFVLSDGEIVRVQLKIVPSSSASDSVIELQPKAELLKKDLNQNAGVPVSDLDLMKAMLRGHSVSGFKKREVGRSVSTGLNGISARLEKMWTGRGEYQGFQFVLTNMTNHQAYEIDLSKLRLGSPNQAVLSQVDHIKLFGKNKKGPKSARLRIVSKKGGGSSEVVLPVAWVKATPGDEK